jgi:hypothetical protein
MRIDLSAFPGGERVARGLSDLEAGRMTAEALLVSIASRRLSDLRLPIAPVDNRNRQPELELYELLGVEVDDPYYAYNALLRELDSFVSCYEAARGSPNP